MKEQVSVSNLKQLTGKIKKFVNERDWEQFHNPKDLALSLVLEAAEVLEHFQWKKPEEADRHAVECKEEIADELADVACYLFELADNLKIDLAEAIDAKLAKNAQKYPVEKSKGRITKYNKL